MGLRLLRAERRTRDEARRIAANIARTVGPAEQATDLYRPTSAITSTSDISLHALTYVMGREATSLPVGACAVRAHRDRDEEDFERVPLLSEPRKKQRAIPDCPMSSV